MLDIDSIRGISQQLEYLAALKAPIKLNVELAPCEGVCDVPTGFRGLPTGRCHWRLIELAESLVYSADVLSCSMVVPDLLLLWESAHAGNVLHRVGEWPTLVSINAAVNSAETASRLKRAGDEFVDLLVNLNVDYIILYVGAEFLPPLATELGRLGKSLMLESLAFLNLHCDLPRTKLKAEMLVSAVKEVARASELSLMNLNLVTARPTSIQFVADVLAVLEPLRPFVNILFKPPLPVCANSLPPGVQFFTGVCPARQTWVTIDSSGVMVPCLHKREPSRQITTEAFTDTWKDYRHDFRTSSGLNVLSSCDACKVQQYCGGVCDVWRVDEK